MILRIAFPLFTLLASSHAMAETYQIDSARSEVRAYVPHWESQASYNNWWTPGLTDPDTGLPIPEPKLYDWTLTWPLSPFSIQGQFQLDVQPSPWVPDVSRLLLSDLNITSDAPNYANFTLANATTLSYYPSSKYVQSSTGVCYDDNYYGGNWPCFGLSSGIVWEVEGNFDGQTLDISGYFWGVMGPYDGATFTGLSDTSPPDYLVNFDEAAGLYTFHSVAVQSVPEPRTFILMFAGLLLLMAKVYFANRASGAKH